jgi:predicted ester cyclase
MNAPEMNEAAAIRFIEAFNGAAWDELPAVVASDFVLHHPMGGTMRLGPEGMRQVWSHFKAAVPDSWHPIPIMIAEGDCVATLLPTYGHFTGDPHQGIPPTGRWLEYGMVNIVRLEDGKLVEGWFGMDPLVELQQMGAAPSPPPRTLSAQEQGALALFRATIDTSGSEFDNVSAFGDVVVALGPPQHAPDTNVRTLEIYRVEDGELSLVRSHEVPTIPPYAGGSFADPEASRALVTRFFDEVLTAHDLGALAELASPDILIHPAAMPCEAGYYGVAGARRWLGSSWDAFPDLTVAHDATVAQGDIVAARWGARGTSTGAFLMLPPTGEVVEYGGVSMYRIEDDTIAEIWDTRNTLGIMLQLNPDLAAGSAPHRVAV